MSKKKKKKAGIGAIFARILVVILTMAVGGIASFFAVRQFFSYKFAKEKKKEVSQQLEKENKELKKKQNSEARKDRVNFIDAFFAPFGIDYRI